MVLGSDPARPTPRARPEAFRGTASLAGGRVGLQQQFGDWVLGTEATWGGGRFDRTTFDAVSKSADPTDMFWRATVTGKLGTAGD